MIDLLFYFCVFSLILFFLRKGDKTGNNIYIYSGYLLLFMLSAFRFDIGNDYAGYWFNSEMLGKDFQDTHSIKQVIELSNGRFEIGFCVLASLFSWSDNAFFWISALFSALVVWGLYKTFSEYNCHFWGTFFVIITGYLFLQWDGVRQSGALSLMLVAYIYADKKDLKRFLACLGLAYLLHKSAIFMLIVYLIQYIKINNKLIFSLLIICLIVYWSGLLDGVVQQISMWFAYVDGYDKYDNANVALSTHTTIFSRIRVSIFVMIGALIISMLDNRYYFYKNCLTIGLVIFMLGGNSLIITRIAWYFMVLIFPCLGLCIKNAMRKSLQSQILYMLLVIQSFTFSYDIATDTNTRGCVPYKSIFSNDFENKRFDIRDYK